MKLIKEETFNCTKEVNRVKMDDGSTIEMIYYISENGEVLDTVCRYADSDEYISDMGIVELVEEFLRNVYAIRHGGTPEMHIEEGRDENSFLGAFNKRKNRPAPLTMVK